MTKLAAWGGAVALLLGTAGAAGASEEVTIEGVAVCAKCTLHQEGLTECQNVLVVESDDDEEQRYHLTLNDVNEEFGDVCMTTRPVQVTGTLSEHDGTAWIEASEIVPVPDRN